MTQYPIKLLKLSNGESVVCKIKESTQDGYITLIEPVRIHKWMSPSDDGGGAFENATFGPWESFSDNQVFHVSNKQIITLTEPREDVIVYYNKIVHRLKSTPVERLDDEPLRNVKQLKDVVDKIHERLGISEEDEDIMEYMYNKDKITKH
tara:strand:- start:596 stop:1045 length:450 start_codon:yes stop_codon:yes gene_type:complete